MHPLDSSNLSNPAGEVVETDVEERVRHLRLADNQGNICAHTSYPGLFIEESDSRAVSESNSRAVMGKSGSTPVFPITRFPVDILVSIFMAAVGTKVQEGTLTMSRVHPAVVASHVCREWREITLETPSLWSHIHFTLPPYPFCYLDFWGERGASFEGMNQKEAEDVWKNTFKQIQEVTEAWLSRSRDSSLSVSLGQEKEIPAVPEEGWPEEEMADGLVHLDKVIDLLCEASRRWKHLNFYCTNTIHTRRLLLVPAQTSGILRSVRMRLCVVSHEKWHRTLMSSATLLATESLRSLEIPDPLPQQDNSITPIKWSNLTNLTFGGYSWSSARGSGSKYLFGGHQALALLRVCSNIKYADIRVVDGQTDWSFEPVLLPFLEELVLRPERSSLPIGFASSLILPSLRKFTVTAGEDGHNIPSVHNGLVECIQQFSSTIVDVTFSYTPLTRSGLYDCLLRLPNITRLHLLGRKAGVDTVESDQAFLSNELLIKMTPQVDESGVCIEDGCLCPMLQEFVCHPNPGMLDEALFVDFISERRSIGASPSHCTVVRLQKVVVDCRAIPFAESYQFKTDVVQELRRRGVDMDDFCFKVLH